MITGWGQHHFESAAWVWILNIPDPFQWRRLLPNSQNRLWDVHGDFMVHAEYENGITMLVSGGYPNGIRYEGTEGWIFCLPWRLCRFGERPCR